jgi:hypothetical protein
MDPVSADWGNFFVAEVGAAAALAGLAAVAISINLARILSFPHLPLRAGETLFALTGVFVLASLALLPGQPARLFGVEALAVGLAKVGFSAYSQVRYLALGGPRRLILLFVRAFAATVSSGAIFVGGGLLTAGVTGGLYVIAFGIIAALTAGVWNAWILLVEILR